MRKNLKQTQTNETPQHHNPQLLQFWNLDTNCSYIWQPFYINNLIQIGFRRCFLTPQTVHGLISVARKLCYSLQQKSIWNTYCGLQGLTVSNEQNMLAQFHPYYNWNQFKKSLQWSKTQPPPQCWKSTYETSKSVHVYLDLHSLYTLLLPHMSLCSIKSVIIYFYIQCPHECSLLVFLFSL